MLTVQQSITKTLSNVSASNVTPHVYTVTVHTLKTAHNAKAIQQTSTYY